MPHLRFVAAQIAGKFMHQDHSMPRTRFLEIQAHLVIGRRVRHIGLLRPDSWRDWSRPARADHLLQCSPVGGQGRDLATAGLPSKKRVEMNRPSKADMTRVEWRGRKPPPWIAARNLS